MIELNKQEADSNQNDIESYVDAVYSYAANLIVNLDYSYNEAKNSLINKGLRVEDADIVIDNIKRQIKEQKRKVANKEFLYGILWAGGGVLLTLITNGTFIFYGAVLYGIYLFIKGVWHKLS